MKIATRVFISSMSFGIVVAIIYWFTSHEPDGTILLGLFAAGFAFVVGYLLVIRPKSELDGDMQRDPRSMAGERIGVFSTESPWPVILALSSAALLIGVVLHPMLVPLAALAFFTAIWGLVRESA
jgi:hypothetical protein